ncbi:unnamed protein product [Rhizoctonia solani]|uniref:DUF7587 domain-containing protein n=1 Tax=Rhizoctonia solani TaxID=456999 RepID=A0A8H2ZYX2_9AGAM|nr:unnamed protein product [Rhizoctonia solani]
MPTHKLPPGIPDRKTASKDDLNFLMGQTRFVYRIFTDKCRSPRVTQGFVAHKYRDYVDGINVTQLLSNDESRYFLALSHIENQENSPWISTTRLWDWAMWRLKSPGEKMTGARVAVIDLLCLQELQARASGLSSERFNGQVIHVLDAISRAELRSASDKPLKEEMVQRARDRANSADEVLIYAMIPTGAIVSTFNLSDIHSSVPRNFTTDSSPASDNQKKKLWKLRRPGKDKHDANQERWGQFRNMRYGWIKELDKEKWDTSHHGRKITELAYSFLEERVNEINTILSQLDNMFKPAADSDPATSSTTESTVLNLIESDGDGDGKERNDDDYNSASSSCASTQLADLIDRAGIYELDADIGSLASLVSAVSRLTTSSKGQFSQESLKNPVPGSNDKPSTNSSELLANLSLLPKSYHTFECPFGLTSNLTPVKQGAKPSGAANESPQDEINSKIAEAQQSINIFCDQLIILASSILEPYWNVKQRKEKDWDILKHAIVEFVKPEVGRMEKITRGLGEIDGIESSGILERFEKSYPPYQWVTSKPPSKGRRVAKIASKILPKKVMY